MLHSVRPPSSRFRKNAGPRPKDVVRANRLRPGPSGGRAASQWRSALLRQARLRLVPKLDHDGARAAPFSLSTRVAKRSVFRNEKSSNVPATLFEPPATTGQMNDAEYDGFLARSALWRAERGTIARGLRRIGGPLHTWQHFPESFEQAPADARRHHQYGWPHVRKPSRRWAAESEFRQDLPAPRHEQALGDKS
jgi:hypothetical protein